MVEMTGEERKVAKFLTEKGFKWEFQPSVSVQDDGNRTRLFNPDFLLTDLNIYIEVCGAERNEHYERTREIYEKNKVPIIYVETYKDEVTWKNYLILKIKEIHEKRQSAVSTIIPHQSFANKPVIQEFREKKYFNFNLPVSKQSQVGVMLIIVGLCLLLLAVLTLFFNVLIITAILLIVGFIVFYFGIYIAWYRFSRWFRNWYKISKENFHNWLKK